MLKRIMTVIIALLSEFVLSLTFFPAMIALFVSGHGEEQENVIVRRLKQLYEPVLRWAMDAPVKVMAIGVASDPACRGRGYAAACIAKLSAALLAEGKTPCLFYDNPSAARIYKALGYRDIGDWSLLINPAAVDVGL